MGVSVLCWRGGTDGRCSTRRRGRSSSRTRVHTVGRRRGRVDTHYEMDGGGIDWVFSSEKNMDSDYTFENGVKVTTKFLPLRTTLLQPDASHTEASSHIYLASPPSGPLLQPEI